jgi:hypothetical protein
MRFYIHSTLTHSHKYHQWSQPTDQNMIPEIIGIPVVIQGGANRATFPDDKFGRHTPKGVMTEVTEEQMDYLNGCSAFQKHVKQGFLTVTHSNEAPERIASDMEKRDNSAPLTPDSPEFNKPDPVEPEGETIVTKAVRVMKGALN